MRRIVYTSPHGDVWDLTPGSADDRASLLTDGVEGGAGSWDTQALNLVGSPGRIRTGLTINESGGTLRVLLKAASAEDLDPLYRRWRQGWSAKQAGLLSMGGSSLGRLTARVYLLDPMPSPGLNPQRLRAMRVEVTWVNDDGVWWTDEIRGTGQVTVTNVGDVTVKPKIRWSGSGGQVTVPSGATFTLPPTQHARILDFDNKKSYQVTDERGVLDKPLWGRLGEVVKPEVVPVLGRREYRLPPGAELVWQLGVLDPWT
ncbi:hypothetical protein [Corynebacterium aquilae]|uniref:hypothetical protein n=1 Tax=Corynebacterium aquilae TaxID=203263 RepID=UPI000AEE50CE|nr:hypothetical protein [Corynebacterium aquilae]